ncbi:MAG: hypothetical protein WCR72_01835 [Bacteroidota bacterium]
MDAKGLMVGDYLKNEGVIVQIDARSIFDMFNDNPKYEPIECLKILKSKIDAAGLNKCNYAIETNDIEAINEALVIANVSNSLPDNVTIEKWAWEKCNMRGEVNLRGLKLKFYAEFLRGAMLMRDWIKGNER